jgi:hypothetical protein
MRNDTVAFRRLADEAFLALGAEQIAYIKDVSLNGALGVGIFSADGKPMATAPSVEIAQAMVRRNELEPALVH